MSDTLKLYLQQSLIYGVQDLSDGQIHFLFVTVPLLPFTMMLSISAEISLSSFSLCVMLPVLVQEINLKSIHVGIVRYCNVLWDFFKMTLILL